MTRVAIKAAAAAAALSRNEKTLTVGWMKAFPAITGHAYYILAIAIN